MYLTDSDEAEVLLRLIDDCERLVGAKTITAGAAFEIVSEAAKHHSDHPGERRKRLVEIEAKNADFAQGLPPAPVPIAPPAIESETDLASNF